MPHRKRVLVLTSSGGGGEWQATAAVALGLHQRGHDVRLAGDTRNAETLTESGLSVSVMPPNVTWDAYFVPWQRKVATQGIAHAGSYPHVQWSQDCIPFVMDLVITFQPDLLVCSLYAVHIGAAVSPTTQVPWCFVNPAFYCGQDAPRPLESDYHPLAIRFFWQHILPVVDQADLVLHATDAVFDFPLSQLPVHHHYVGPLWWETPAQPPAYLEATGDPWVLATLSSKAQPGEQDLAEMVVRVLGRQPVRAVMTVREPHLLGGCDPLPSNIHVEAHVPHSGVLKQSRLFLSPAGHGAVMKALYYGVPMVLIPQGSDQPGVAARAERLGVAQVITREECTDERLEHAIQEILDEPQYRQQAQAASHRLRSYNPVTMACDLIEQL